MVWRAVLRGWDIPPPCWLPTPTIASTPHRAVAPPNPVLPPPPPPNPVLPPISPRCTPPPVAGYWRSQPLARRLRAIRPTLVGYVFVVLFLFEYWWVAMLSQPISNLFQFDSILWAVSRVRSHANTCRALKSLDKRGDYLLGPGEEY